MPEQAQQGERTEAATLRRLQRAREEGQIPISRELVTLSGLAAVTFALVLAAPATIRDLATQLGTVLAHAHELDVADGSALRFAGILWLHGAAPFVLAAMFAGVAAVLLQTRLLLNARALRVDFSRLSPRAGLRRLFSVDSLVEAAKSLAKIIVLAFAAWHVLRADLPVLEQALLSQPGQILVSTANPALHVLLAVLAAQAGVAALDLFWVFLRHARQLRMSRHDIQEEQKETEGDPRVRARIRQIRMFRARKRMLAAVPKATVVITNPTHYAVALAYDRAKYPAPRVVAKGVDSLAARIREVAAANRVPLVANPPLAQALYRVELDADIPVEHYQAVAEIIAYVWRLGRAH
jgi:flagellar biosynthetic protein FlhB